MQKRRHGKGQRANQASGRAEGEGPYAGWRQFDRNEGVQSFNDQQVQSATRRQPQHDADRADHAENAKVAGQDAGRPGTEGLEDAHMVVVAAGIAVRRKRHGDPGEQHRQQPAKQQKALRPVQGGADARAAFANAHPAEIGFHAQLLAQRLKRRIRPAQQQPVADAAAGLHHLGGRHVGQVHQQPGPQVEEAAAPVRLLDQHPGHLERRHAHLHRVAQTHAQGGKQPGVDPDLARHGHIINRGAPRKGLHSGDERPPQRVILAHRLDGNQLVALIASEHHGGEGQHIRGIESPLLSRMAKLIRNGTGTADVAVRGQEIGRLQQQRLMQPIHEQADGGDGADGHQQGRQQQAKLPGAPVAPSHAGCET